MSKKKHNKKSKTGGTNVVHKAAAPSGIKHDLGTANFQVNGRIYLFSMFGYVLAAHIFAQAVFMNYPEIKLLFFADFMRSEWFAIIGHLALFGIIFALACSKGVPEYTKEIIKR